jgi:hypothetical protein
MAKWYRMLDFGSYLKHSVRPIVNILMLNKHNFNGQRWLSITLRSLHLVGIVLAAMAIFGNSPYQVAAFASTLTTGLGLYAIDLWGGQQHWRELAGAFTLFKLLLVLVMILIPSYSAGLFWFLLISSSLVSHAPKSFRHIRLFG